MRSRIVFISVFLIAFLIAKSQSVNFQYSPNKLIIKKEIDLDKKDFQINGDTKVCKGKATEFMISTGAVSYTHLDVYKRQYESSFYIGW